MSETESLIKKCQEAALKFWLKQKDFKNITPRSDDVMAICVNFDTDDGEWEAWVDVFANAGGHLSDLSDDLYGRDVSLKETLLFLLEAIESEIEDEEPDSILNGKVVGTINLGGKTYSLVDQNESTG